jgi:hypothetical protein
MFAIRQLINDNHVEEAMSVLRQNPDVSLQLQNARAVCFMRMGQPRKVAEILTPFVYVNNSKFKYNLNP